MSVELPHYVSGVASKTDVIQMASDIQQSVMQSDIEWCNLGAISPLQNKVTVDFWEKCLKEIDLRNLATKSGAYANPMGHESFRECLAQIFNEEYGWDIEPSQILVGVGSQYLLFMILNYFTGALQSDVMGKVLIPTQPEYVGYPCLKIRQNSIGAKPFKIESMDSKVFRYGLNIDADDFSSENYKAILTSSPRNPTGSALSKSEFNQLNALAENYRIPLVIDSAYSAPFFNFGDKGESLELTDQTIYSFTFSKCGLPGERIGILIGSKDVIAALGVVQCNSMISPPVFGQTLGNI
jgi:valine--pyruvate aminotransferase